MKNCTISTLSIFALFAISCSSGIPQAEYDKIVTELASCKANVEELENTPDRRLSKALQNINSGMNSVGIEQLNELITKYPNSDEAKTASKKIAEVEERQRKEQEEKDRLKRLGFKAFKEDKTIDVADVSLSFSTPKITSSWSFDRYGDRYMYRKAERGSKYITSTLSIKAKTNNPSLPPIHVYKVDGDQLEHINTFTYEFYRWKNYGAYLGNYADFSNDFAQTEKIRFAIGVSLLENESKEEVIFMLVEKKACYQRKNNEFSNPPVKYEKVGCDPMRRLSLEQVKNNFEVVKIFNKGKL